MRAPSHPSLAFRYHSDAGARGRLHMHASSHRRRSRRIDGPGTAAAACSSSTLRRAAALAATILIFTSRTSGAKLTCRGSGEAKRSSLLPSSPGYLSRDVPVRPAPHPRELDSTLPASEAPDSHLATRTREHRRAPASLAHSLLIWVRPAHADSIQRAGLPWGRCRRACRPRRRPLAPQGGAAERRRPLRRQQPQQQPHLLSPGPCAQPAA